MVGVNCHFDPQRALDAIEKMKAALEKEKLDVHLMVQPLGYHTPDAGKQGFIDLPEFPFGMLAFQIKVICIAFFRLKCCEFTSIRV